MTHPGGYAQIAMATLLCCAPFALSAQNNDGGTSTELSFTERLLLEDGETSLRSDIGLSWVSQTRTQSLSFSAFGSLDKLDTDSSSDGLEDPRVQLDYGLDNRNAAFTFSLQYRRTDVDSLSDDSTGTSVVLDDGKRDIFVARTGFEIGRDAPFGASFSLGYSSADYIDTSSTLLLDNEAVDGTVRLRFDIDQRIQTYAMLSVSDLDRDGGIDVRRETLSFGTVLEISPVLTAQAEIGATRVTQDGTITRTVDEGGQYSFGLVRSLTNGTLSGTLTSDLDENGRRTTLQVTRAMELPNGALSFGAGLTQNTTTNSSTRPLLNLAYTHDLPRGSINATFSQSYTSDSIGNETLSSLLQLRVQQELTQRDRLSARLELSQADRTGGAVNSRGFDIGFDYARSLTEDWSFVGGYTHSRRSNSGGAEDKDDTFFIGLRTNLAWRS